MVTVVPDFNGGAPVSEFEVLLKGMDNCPREVYKGRDLECTVAGLLPGRPYLFQVRALNKAGVSANVAERHSSPTQDVMRCICSQAFKSKTCPRVKKAKL